MGQTRVDVGKNVKILKLKVSKQKNSDRDS